MLFYTAVEARALELLRKLDAIEELRHFYLVGGTALALHFGHRVSVDLDFFTAKKFDTNELLQLLGKSGKVKLMSQSVNALTVDCNGVKVDFIRHSYPILNPILQSEGSRIASVQDIAAMKMNSLTNRGAKKDFFDLHELLQHFSLQQLLDFYAAKYETASRMVALKSLVYFEDAEMDPDPVSVKNVTWGTVKSTIVRAVREFEFE